MLANTNTTTTSGTIAALSHNTNEANYDGHDDMMAAKAQSGQSPSRKGQRITREARLHF